MELLRQLQDSLGQTKAPSDDKESKTIRKKACVLAEKLWQELVEPGDFIDRILFQVRFDHYEAVA